LGDPFEEKFHDASRHAGTGVMNITSPTQLPLVRSYFEKFGWRNPKMVRRR